MGCNQNKLTQLAFQQHLLTGVPYLGALLLSPGLGDSETLTACPLIGGFPFIPFWCGMLLLLLPVCMYALAMGLGELGVELSDAQLCKIKKKPRINIYRRR